jgi:ribonucleoside-diphosphate reductase alpha chain
MKDEQAWEWLDKNDLSYSIWENKYRNGDETLEQWLDRISGGDSRIRTLIKDKKFAFGGRIMANRGIKDAKVSLSNCYVIEPPEDNLKSIMGVCRDLAITYSRGGGCGVDLSKLRPCGAKVNNAAKESTGPVSFMELYSQVTGTISQNGRRGALMISLDVNHPDVEKFIDIKTDLTKVNYANISIKVNDAFMEAVKSDSDYMLCWPTTDKTAQTLGFDYKKEHPDMPYNELIVVSQHVNRKGIIDNVIYVKRIKARNLYLKLCKNNWDYAEPGILFWDTVREYNMLNNNNIFEFAGVNPCRLMCRA